MKFYPSKICAIFTLFLLLSGCGPTRMGIENGTGAIISNLQVVMNGQTWDIQSLAQGELVEKEYKIIENTSPRLSYLNQKGQKIWGSADLEFKKGQTRKVVLFLNTRGLVEVREKGKQEKRKY